MLCGGVHSPSTVSISISISSSTRRDVLEGESDGLMNAFIFFRSC